MFIVMFIVMYYALLPTSPTSQHINDAWWWDQKERQQAAGCPYK